MDQARRLPKARLRITGPVKFSEAERLASQLDQMLAVRAVEIDATGLEETDASLLQVVCSARVQAERLGQELSVVFPKEGPVAQLIERLGLASQLLVPVQRAEQVKG